MQASTTGRQVLRGLYQSPGTFATCLLALLLDEYGPEVLDWEPQTVVDTLYRELNVDLPPANADKIQAAIGVITTDQFWTDPLALTHTADAFNGEGVDPESFEEPTPEALAWAVLEARLLRGDPPEFSHKVRRYMGAVLQEHGLTTAPRELEDAEFTTPPEDQLRSIDQDPDLYKAFYDRQGSDIGAVHQYVEAQAMAMLQQLDSLPIAARNRESWEKVMAGFR